MTLRADLGQRVALVTGATGALGGRFARVLRDSGAVVVACGRNEAKLAALRGEGFLALAMDVTSRESVRAAFDAAERAVGPVEIVVNNAGISSGSLALDTEDAELATVLETDLAACFRVAT
jgi:3-oxoacyl-[acyl-carrier protein] reductase